MSNWDKATGKLFPSAQWYATIGWKILPCYGIDESQRCNCNGQHGEPKDIGKHPAIDKWNAEATSDIEKVNEWWERNPEFNIGVFCRPSGFLVIDVDPRSGGVESFDKFEALLEGNLPKTVEAYTGQYTNNGKNVRGRHLFYKCDPSEELFGNLNKQGLKGIDIKHNGYVLITPSRHFSGNTYEWVEGQGPHEIEMAEAPEELLSVLRKSSRRSKSTDVGLGDWESVFDGLDFSGEKVDVNKLLQDGIDEGERAIKIYQLACALANKFPVDTEAGRLALETLMIRFNSEKVRPPMALEGPNSVMMHTRRAIDFVVKNPKTQAKIWPGLQDWANASQEESRASVTKSSSKEVERAPMLGVVLPPEQNVPGTRSSALLDAIESGVSFEQALSSSNLDLPPDRDAVSEQDGGDEKHRSLTDIGNGRRLVDNFKDVVRYTSGLGWFHWKDGYWKPDPEVLEIRELAKRIPTIVASEITSYEKAEEQAEVIRWAQQSKSIARIRSGIDTANSDPRINVPVTHWDKDEYLLGVMNGVVDLRTGDLLQHRPDLFITRRATVGYIKGQKNTRWEQFLDYATGGDKEFQAWLQRAAGYSITGSRRYDVMFLVYGPPGSGKNTFVEALVKCLGTQEYAWPLDSSILAQQDGKANGQDLYHWAELRGRRIVWVDELPDNERIKENSVKKLTGSTNISARSPGEKPFSFESRAKLWISTNHRPIITDDAMWRRIRTIPFLHTPEKPDPDLKEYLFDPDGGLGAVLSWAVEGAVKVIGSGSRDGLGTCKVVEDASDVYRKNEDRIQIFLSEETREKDGASIPMKTVYAIYRNWSEDRGERPMPQIAFHRKLSEKNIKISGTGTHAVVLDRCLIPRAIPSGDVDWDIATRIAR